MDAPATGGVAASPAIVINSEVKAVLAVMRRNVRWGGRYGSAADDPQLDHSLVRSLKSLRRQVFDWNDGSRHTWSSVNPVAYLRPFLDVVRSEEAGAPITGAALSSVQRILLDVLVKAGGGPRVSVAMRLVVEAVTGCRFEVTDPASEEAVLMKILQVLLACMKSQAAAAVLSDQDVCAIVNACFRIVHQAGTKGELLQRVARQTMHELVRCIFEHLKDVEDVCESAFSISEMSAVDKNQSFGIVQGEVGDGSLGTVAPETINENSAEEASDKANIFVEPYGIPCMVETFHFLCSLLNIVDQVEISRTMNQIAYDEDVPLLALSMLNSAIELGGPFVRKHANLLSLIQDELFQNLMQFGLSMSPLILSMVCNIVLNSYHSLRTDLKLQLEAFFSYVLLRLAQSRYGASYHQQEVAMEAIVDFCRQKTFMNEMYANFDCEITCSNVFEELVNLLSKSAFPVNCPLSSIHLLALDGLIAVVQEIADRIDNEPPHPEPTLSELGEYTPFWTLKCDNYSDPSYLVKFVQLKKSIKRKLIIGVNHFNADPKKGLEYLQGAFILPEKLDPQSVACFFRFASGLDKNVVGDFLGNHDTFSIQVLHEFARMFDFQGMKMDNALRLFLDTFRLPGESQKIHRVLEALAERYFEQSPHILADKDSALVLAYSLIMLNTDQHNSQVKKKMTEEDFIRNNRRINGGNDLPREFLSELYHSICRNEIRTIPDLVSGSLEMSSSRWIDLMQKSKNASPYILCDSRPVLGRYMFDIMSDPTIAAISVVFDNAEHEEVFLTCIDGFLDVAKISAHYHLIDALDNIVVFLCKFSTLLDSSLVEEPISTFGDDIRARLATETVFTIANSYGDFIRTGWRSILDCIIKLHKLGLLPASFTGDAADDPDLPVHDKLAPSSLPASAMQTIETPRRSFGLMGRFSQLLSFDTEEPQSQPTEEELAARQRTLQTIEKCHIGSIITESKFLQADSLMQLARALVLAAGPPQRVISSSDDEDVKIFCLELLIAITLNNRDRIKLLWPVIYEHIANIVQTMAMPCALVEKSVFGLLRICQRLLPYKLNLADDLLKSLQLVLKLDARVADVYCESITQEVTRLVKSNATHIKTKMGWQTIISLLSITARHPEASEIGFEALEFIMSEGARLSPVNYILCVQASRHFADSKVGPIDRSVRALDLMVESANCLVSWSREAKVGEEAEKISEGIREMWLRLVEALKKVSLDQRDGVRNHAMLSLQSCLIGIEGIPISTAFWLQAFDRVLFTMLDELLEIAQNHSQKVYQNLETTLLHAMKLLMKAFLHSLQDLVGLSSFMELWQGILGRMQKYMKFKVKKSDKLQELIPELLKNTLLVMKTKDILAVSSGGLWDLTWPYVNSIAPSLQSEVFPGWEEQLKSGIQPVGVSSAPLATTALQTSLEV